jgi:hypothetical protein
MRVWDYNDLRETGLGYGVNSVGSGYEPVAGSCKSSDEPSGSGVMELVNCKKCNL